MFDFIAQKFSSLSSYLTGVTAFNEHSIEHACTTITDSLLEADVPHELVTEFVEGIKQEFASYKSGKNIRVSDAFLKVVQAKLVAFLGGSGDVEFSFQLPSVVMMMGLQGSGKTTTIAKLVSTAIKQAAKRGKKRSILVASVDFYRPAAVDQLEQLARQVDATFYRATTAEPLAAVREIHAKYKNEKYDLLFLDTAGRLHVDTGMLKELQEIVAVIEPKYKLLVLDAMTGQESLSVARAFDQIVGFDGAILTKMDSDTRGGAAFSFRYALRKPIRFVGTGEKIDDLDQFYPERIAQRMLGMGDLKTLAERAEEKLTVDDQRSTYSKLSSGRMTLQDFADQMAMMNKIGSLSQIVKYMPGFNTKQMSPDLIDKGEVEMRRFKAIISSMTPKERASHKLLNGSRKERVARGAGVTVNQVNLLLERFEQLQQYAKLLKKGSFFGRLFS